MPNLDRGDNGVEADPSWASLWSTWHIDEVQQYLAQAAVWGQLNWPQAVALVQGLPPPPKGWQDPCTVLDDYADAVHHLGRDMARGALCCSPSPRELAAWCERHSFPLPALFEESLAALESTTTEFADVPESDVEVALPAWVPLAPTARQPASSTRKVGRPRTAKPVYDAITAAALELLRSRAESGVVTTVAEIARQLTGTPQAAGMQTTSISRRLKGALPLKAMKAQAMRVQAKRRAP